MKLTNEILKQMIMEELERLDEFKVTVNPSPNISPLASSLGISKSDLYSAAAAGGQAKSAGGAKTAAKSLAALGGASPNDIDDGDFAAAKAARSSKPNDYNFADELQQKSSNKAFKKDWAGTTKKKKGKKSSGGGFGPYAAVPKGSKALYAAAKTAANAYVNSKGKDADAKDALTAYLAAIQTAKYTGQTGVTKALWQYAGLPNKQSWDAVITGLIGGIKKSSPGTVDKKLTSKLGSLLKAINTGIQIDDREFSDFMGPSGVVDVSRTGIATATDKTIKKTTAKADSSVLSQFGVYSGQSITDIIDDLANVASILKNKNFGAVTNKFEFITKVNLLTKLAAMGKGVDDSAAGFEFEKYCALLFGGAQVGGDNGAVDAYAILTSGHAVSTSQKFFKETSSVKQSKTTMSKLFQARKGDNIFFITAIKSDGSKIGGMGTGKHQQYTRLDLFITEITKSGTNYQAQNIIYNSNKLTYGTQYICKQDTSDVYVFMGLPPGASGKNKNQGTTANRFIQIPVLSAKSADISAAAKYAHEQLTSAGSPLKKLSQAVQGIFKRLQNMQYNTEEYIGVKGGSSFDNSQKATDYIDQIATDYTDVKSSYKDMFTASGDLAYAKAQKIAENENNLDKVLDKLIKEVILNK